MKSYKEYNELTEAGGIKMKAPFNMVLMNMDRKKIIMRGKPVSVKINTSSGGVNVVALDGKYVAAWNYDTTEEAKEAGWEV
jgi:hypothetical protein